MGPDPHPNPNPDQAGPWAAADAAFMEDAVLHESEAILNQVGTLALALALAPSLT